MPIHYKSQQNKMQPAAVKSLWSILLTTLVLTLGVTRANAQLIDYQSVYFQNQYLANPAMAGLGDGLNLNAGYERQWTSVPGSPTFQNLTVDYNAGNRTGLGLIINNASAGLISSTRIMGTYAYHLPLDGRNNKLNFGLSAGVNDSYIDNTKIVADGGDLSVQNFNRQGLYFDGDLGISYTGDGLNMQAALPNLGSVLFSRQQAKLDAGRSTFFTGVSYKIQADNGQSDLCIEPKAVFRGINNSGTVFDAGANIAINNNRLNFSGMYHTNQSATLAFALSLDKIGLMLAYTNNTGTLRTYVNDTFEIGLNYKLTK